MRRMILAVAGVALLGAIWLSWPDASDDVAAITTVGSSTTMASSPAPSSTTTTVLRSTTTSLLTDSHVVETVEEAEAILRELWFGWFDGIYHQDEDRIREVVGNPTLVDQAIRQFGLMEFVAEPIPSAIGVRDTAILTANESCLAIWAQVDASPIIGQVNDGVHVFLYDDRWMFIAQWADQNDLWRNDCESQL